MKSGAMKITSGITKKILRETIMTEECYKCGNLLHPANTIEICDDCDTNYKLKIKNLELEVENLKQKLVEEKSECLEGLAKEFKMSGYYTWDRRDVARKLEKLAREIRNREKVE